MFTSKQHLWLCAGLTCHLRGCELCNMMFHKEFTRMSRDSSCSAQLKLVISEYHHVGRELARYRRGKGCFPKPMVCSNFPM